jgi:hypothetical protein
VSAPDEGRLWGHDEATLPSIGELTGRPADPDETLAEVRHQLGIGSRRVRYGGGLPDAGGLVEGLGLR